MRRARESQGSVVLNRRSGTWHFLWLEAGKRRSKVIGSLDDFRTKASAWREAETLKFALQQPNSKPSSVRELIECYRREKMPERFSTKLAYEAWFNNHILPRWGDCRITDLQARPIELWLRSLPLSGKSMVHVRGLVRALWEYAMWRGEVPIQRNPMELVTIRGGGKRKRQPRSLTVDEFRMFVDRLDEPIRTIALVCVCFGMRISECLALKWRDVNWLSSKLAIERAIVRQRVDDVKTIYSGRLMAIDAGMLEVFKGWRQRTQFASEEDWIFASPVQLGRLPVSYPWVWLAFQKAAAKSGIGKLGTHSLRHSYRSWLDAVGTAIAVQQKLMRHSDIRTTMNIYGDVVTDEMERAHSKVVALALNRGSAPN